MRHMFQMIMVVSDREPNENRNSHVDQNDKLGVILLNEASFADLVQFR